MAKINESVYYLAEKRLIQQVQIEAAFTEWPDCELTITPGPQVMRLINHLDRRHVDIEAMPQSTGTIKYRVTFVEEPSQKFFTIKTFMHSDEREISQAILLFLTKVQSGREFMAFLDKYR